MTFVQVHCGSDQGLLRGQPTGIDAHFYPVDNTDIGTAREKTSQGGAVVGFQIHYRSEEVTA
jgi:hypothetical protein